MIQFPHAIDNSMRKELVKCEMAAHYKYELGLAPLTETRVDLHAGKAFASGIEAMRRAYYADGFGPHDSLDIGIRALYTAYGSFECPPPAKYKAAKTADRMAGALARYAADHPLDLEPLRPIRLDATTLGIEVSFNFPIGIAHPVDGVELTYCGRFDMLAIDDNDSSVWVVDEKTTGDMGDKWSNQWLLDGGLTGYCWGAQKLLQQYGLPNVIKGAIINGIAIKMRDYDCARFTSYRQDWEIERWYRQLIWDINNWKNAYESKFHDQALDHACAQYNNPCQFAPLCKSRNPERLIEGSYVIKRWNPLTREETII